MLRKIKLLFYGLLISVSILCGFRMIFLGFYQRNYYTECDEKYAECEAEVIKKFHVSNNNPKYYLQFKYYIDDVEYICTYKGHEFENTYEDAYIGKKATLTYNPENPKEFYIKDYIDYGRGYFVSGICCIVVVPIVFSVWSGYFLYVYIEKFFMYIWNLIKRNK